MPSDLWTQQDDLLFLKYCPSKRERCYHAISRDLSARPHEILKLKIRDLSFKMNVFPKLLESPDVLPEDKPTIVELLKKPWNPYIRRHSALTEKSAILKEHVLRQHAGWSGSSQMHLKYLHFFGNESNQSLLEAYGIVASGQQIDQLRPKQCPNCSEPNKPDSKFCTKCRMVLTYDAISETKEEKEKEVIRKFLITRLVGRMSLR